MKPDRRAAMLLALLACGAAMATITRAADAPKRPVCVADAGLHCFDGDDLSPRWHAPDGLAFDSSLVVGELALAAGSSGIAAYSLDGRERWRRSEFGPVFEPRGSGGAIYLGSLRGDLVRLRTADGTTVWQRRLPGWVYAPALLDDRVVTGGSAGKLFAFDRETGEPLWIRDLGQELVYRPVEAGGDALIATTFDGFITMFDRHGERRWRRHFGVAARSPVVVGERLYSSLLDGRVVALSLVDGGLLWQRAFSQPVELVAAGTGIAGYDVDGVVVLDPRGDTSLRRRFDDALLRAQPQSADRLVLFLRRAAGSPYAIALDRSAGD